MSRLCVVISFLCDVVCLFMCLWHGLYSLFVSQFHWFVLCVLFWYSIVFLFLVCMFCLRCIVLLFVVSLVCSACVLLSLLCVRVCFFCFGLNASPVCDCIVCVPSLRCSFTFLCDGVCSFMCLC